MFEEGCISEENAKIDEELGVMILNRSIWANSLDKSKNGDVVKLDLKATDVVLPSIYQSKGSKCDKLQLAKLVSQY
jgi:hypothetical protein